MHIDYHHWPYCLWRHFLLSDTFLVVIQTDPKGSLWDVASQGEAVSVTSFLQEAALKKIQKYASHSCIHNDSYIMFQKNMWKERGTNFDR